MNLKTQLLLACIALGLLACKKDEHAGHNHGKETGKTAKPIAGPNGGKLLENSAPRAEFLIGKDNRVTITFFDEKLKPVAASGQVVAVTAESKSGKVSLTLEAKDGAFVSKEALPDGDDYNIVVQVKSSAEGTPQNFRISFDLHECGGCKLKEYACTCGH